MVPVKKSANSGYGLHSGEFHHNIRWTITAVSEALSLPSRTKENPDLNKTSKKDKKENFYIKYEARERQKLLTQSHL